MKLAPLIEIADEIQAILEKDPNAVCFQQFQCSGCKAKQTIEEPNVLFTSGKCEECGAVTDIAKDGCNFMMVTTMTGKELGDLLP